MLYILLVGESERGIINGVELTNTKIASLLSYVGGIALNHPKDFVWLVVASCGFVLIAAILYTFWAITKGKQYIDTYGKREGKNIVEWDVGDESFDEEENEML